ncbi:MAG: tetratricopeptide repeat protein [Desulfobacterales bacterium]|nr:tetratricopeptide repeat protein [Desulfobacterales bacterium]MBF0397440.1 tetratricopeptide repeat protein [Desulfobacterales bacterium]
MKHFIIIFLMGIISFSQSFASEVETIKRNFEQSFETTLSESDVKVIAVCNAKDLVIEDVVSYLKSQNYNLSKETLQAIAIKIVHFKRIKEEVNKSPKIVKAFVEGQIYSTILPKQIPFLLRDKVLIDEIIRVYQNEKTLLFNISTLKNEKQNIKEIYQQTAKKLKAIESYYESIALFNKEHLPSLKQATEKLNTALALYPNFVEAYSRRGLSYFYLEDYKQAILNYSEAIKIDPIYAEALWHRGISYQKTEQYEQSIKDLNEAIRLNLKNAECYKDRGITYYNLKQYDAAIADFTKALELDNNLTEVYYHRGMAYNGLQKLDLAAEDFNKVMKKQ